MGESAPLLHHVSPALMPCGQLHKGQIGKVLSIYVYESDVHGSASLLRWAMSCLTCAS